MKRLALLLEGTDATPVLDEVAARCLPYVMQGVLAEAQLAGMEWSEMLVCLDDDDLKTLERIVIDCDSPQRSRSRSHRNRHRM